jgi:hypothetical protein
MHSALLLLGCGWIPISIDTPRKCRAKDSTQGSSNTSSKQHAYSSADDPPLSPSGCPRCSGGSDASGSTKGRADNASNTGAKIAGDATTCDQGILNDT